MSTTSVTMKPSETGEIGTSTHIADSTLQADKPQDRGWPAHGAENRSRSVEQAGQQEIQRPQSQDGADI